MVKVKYHLKCIKGMWKVYYKRGNRYPVMQSRKLKLCITYMEQRRG